MTRGYGLRRAICWRPRTGRRTRWRRPGAASRCVRISGLRPRWRGTCWPCWAATTRPCSVLSEAAARAENSALWAQLAVLQTELDRYAEAGRSLDRYAETTPLREKRETEWLTGVRSDVAYGLGDYEAAARLAEECGSPFHKVVAPRLRQARRTRGGSCCRCPSSASTTRPAGPPPSRLSAATGRSNVRHVEVVEQICYDGTSHYDERRWAEDAGYRAREFTVTWDAAVALLDRGVPFTLTSTYPSFAHLQAVAGYDARRGTLLVREPSSRHLVEALGAEALKLQASTGPRGMAMVPAAQAALLDGLALPDADLYDLHYRMSAALRSHDRPEAERLHAAMNDAAPGHRLTHVARLALADYDQDGAARLRQVEGLLRLYPDDPFLLSRKLIAYPEGLSRQERGDLLRRICGTKDVDPFFLVELAYWLREDGRLLPEALGTLHRAVRHHGHTGPLYYVLGHVLWGLRRVDEAVAVYRLAMCLDDANEALSRTYLAASRHLKQSDRAVKFLAARFVRHGRRSGQPALILFWAYEQLDLMDKAFAVIEEGLALRPDDENLLLAAADDNARYGRFDRAETLLEKARDHSRRTAWLRTAADVARTRGDTAKALELSQEVLAAEPYATDLHAQVARLLATTKGRAAALSHLRKAVVEFPHSYLLHTTLIEWLRPEDAKEHEAGVRGLLAVYPINAWARRELALAVRRERRFDEALSEVGLACVLDPVSPVGPTIRAGIEMAAGRIDAARESARQAIRMSVDADEAISILIESYATHADRRQVLDFVKQELIRQVIFGDGLLAYREHARGILGHGELLASLREAVAARPDLWHAWSALASHLTDMGDLDEAERMARATAERFPLLPRIWLDLAHVRRAQARHGGGDRGPRKGHPDQPPLGTRRPGPGLGVPTGGACGRCPPHPGAIAGLRPVRRDEPRVPGRGPVETGREGGRPRPRRTGGSPGAPLRLGVDPVSGVVRRTRPHRPRRGPGPGPYRAAPRRGQLVAGPGADARWRQPRGAPEGPRPGDRIVAP